MKNFSFNTTLVGLFFAILFIFASCAKDDNILTPQASPQATDLSSLETNAALSDDVSVNQGILHFKQLSDFRSSLLALNRMNSQDRLLWEINLGFVSMQTIFNTIIHAEFEKGTVTHSDLYLEKMESRLIANDEKSGLYKLNLFNPAYAYVLNEQGLVMVNNVLYHFTANELKTWNNADINNLEVILNASTNTADIQIFPVQYEGADTRNTAGWTDECTSLATTSRIALSGFFSSSFVDPNVPQVIFIDYYINVQTLVADGNGGMQFDPGAEWKLQGKSHTDLTISDGVNEEVKVLENRYEVEGTGGNSTFITDAAGEYHMEAPEYFVDSGRLIENVWEVAVGTSNGNEHRCELTYN